MRLQPGTEFKILVATWRETMTASWQKVTVGPHHSETGKGGPTNDRNNIQIEVETITSSPAKV